MKRILLPLSAFAVAFAVGAVFTGDPPPPAWAPATNSPAAEKPSGPAATPAFTAASAVVWKLGRNASLRDFAEVAQHLEHLDSNQIAALMDLMEKSEEHPTSLYRWWIARDPAAASAWIRPRLRRFLQDGPLGMTFEQGSHQLVTIWAWALPEEAMEFARQNPHSDLSAYLLTDVLRTGSSKERGYPANQTMLRDFPAGPARFAGLKLNLERWAREDPAAALEAAQAVTDPRERDKLVRTVFESWPGKEMSAAIERYRQLDFRDPEILAGVLSKVASKDPAVALRILGQLDPQEIARAAPDIIHSWASKDPIAALQWAREHNISLGPRTVAIFDRTEHNSLGRQSSHGGGRNVNPLKAAFEKDASATLQWIRSLPAEERNRLSALALPYVESAHQLELYSELTPDSQARMTTSIIHGFREADKARQWVDSLPAGNIRENAWYAYGSAQTELADLPPGPERDAMLHGRSLGSGVRNVETDLGFVSQIGDATRRREAFDQVMETYVGSIPGQLDRAQKFLEESSFPEEWKRNWRAAQGGSTPR